MTSPATTDSATYGKGEEGSKKPASGSHATDSGAARPTAMRSRPRGVRRGELAVLRSKRLRNRSTTRSFEIIAPQVERGELAMPGLECLSQMQDVCGP